MKYLLVSLFCLSAVYAEDDVTQTQVYERLSLTAAELLLKQVDEEAEEINHGVWRLKMQNFTVVFYNQFDRVQLFAGFSGYKSTLEAINEWNQGRRFSRAYLDANGDPCLEADMNLRGGVGLQNIKSFFEIYDTSLRLFAERLTK